MCGEGSAAWTMFQNHRMFAFSFFFEGTRIAKVTFPRSGLPARDRRNLSAMLLVIPQRHERLFRLAQR